MKKPSEVFIEPRRAVGIRDEKIYGHFLEHFHRQIYGGIYAPDSPLADERGFRKDVIDALKEISLLLSVGPAAATFLHIIGRTEWERNDSQLMIRLGEWKKPMSWHR